jgi:hypothetical protein
MPEQKCNINILTALKKHGLVRNGEPFWAFKMDNDMHLIDISFEEAKVMTNGLCKGLEQGSTKIVEEMKAAYADPADMKPSYIARK